MSFFEWIGSRPWYALWGIYLFVGGVVGIFARMMFARHLYIRHGHEEVKSIPGYNCWCEPDFGHFVSFLIYIAPFVWPILAVVLIFALPAKFYGAVQNFIAKITTTGLKKWRADLWSLDEANTEVTRLRNEVQDKNLYIATMAQQYTELGGRLGIANMRIAELERKTPDERVDEALERSRKLLENMANRPVE